MKILKSHLLLFPYHYGLQQLILVAWLWPHPAIIASRLCGTSALVLCLLLAWPRVSLLKRTNPKIPHLGNSICRGPFQWLLPSPLPTPQTDSFSSCLACSESVSWALFPILCSQCQLERCLYECTVWLSVTMGFFPLLSLPTETLQFQDTSTLALETRPSVPSMCSYVPGPSRQCETNDDWINDRVSGDCSLL